MTDVLARIRAWGDPALCMHLPDAVPVGIPFAVKDNIDVAGMPTTAGCPEFAYLPRADATVVARLRAAGYVPVAKTNLDQFATGLVGTRSPFGTPRNRFDPLRIPGGSSSGSACAVAAGLVPFALGTDTAGSGRVPAALQGLIGLKPTRGWLSTRGVVPAVRSLDCVSVFAASVTTAWEITGIAAGFDPEDPFSRRKPEVVLPRGSLRIGVLAEPELAVVTPGLRAAYARSIARLQALGHRVSEIDFAPFRHAAELLYGGAWVAERAAAVGEFLATNPPGADPVVAGIIRAGATQTAIAAWRGTYELARLRRLADQEWARIDVLILPTVSEYPTLAEVAADPVGVNSRLGRFTNFANLLDTCALAVPAGMAGPADSPDGHLPAGVTLFAPAWHDALLAELGAAMGGEPPIPCVDDGITVAVFGAHLRGQPLHGHLLAWGAQWAGECQTAPVYRLHRVEAPVRPGLVRVASGGTTIAGELWRLPAAGFGRLVAAVLPPLAIGTIELHDGTRVPGFVCETYAAGEDLSAFGNWRAYLASGGPPAGR